MSALTDIFTSLANKIRTKLGTTTTYTPTQAIAAIDDVYDKGYADAYVPTQTKTVTATASGTVSVMPDSGYTLSEVTVNPTPSQTKSATPSTSAQTITPDSGKLLSSVSISAISTQEKTVTASRSVQTVTPDSGKYLSKVTVNKYPDATGTYTYPANSTGATYDMGTTNNLRYVNASNVYAKGKIDAHGSNHYNAALPSGSTINNMTSDKLMLIMVESAGMSKPTVTNATWIFTLGYLNDIECHVYKPTGGNCKVTTDGARDFLIEVLT